MQFWFTLTYEFLNAVDFVTNTNSMHHLVTLRLTRTPDASRVSGGSPSTLR